MRKIFVLTGKRGGYGAMKPMLRQLRDNPDIELQLVVTDQHVNPKFGNTVAEIEKEFTVAAMVDMEQANDTELARAQAVGRAATKMADVLAELEPDICVLYGDRGEVMATAMSATLMGIPVAHLQGGDLSGSVDEQMRHAVTKLSHLHFPSTDESAERICRMGEEPWRVQAVGDNHIDLIVAGEYAPPQQVASALDLDLETPIIIVLQHSETTAPMAAYDQMVETLEAVCETEHQAVVVHPCSDPGYEGVLRAIDEHARPPQFRVHVNLEAPLFWGLMNCAAVMIGNSSAGLIETPYFGLPAINVGRRQEGRLHANNLVNVAHDRADIGAALATALHDEEFRAKAENCTRPFGDGKAGERIALLLAEVELDDRLRIKRMSY
jgi:GDP/UDP-N,N'-diacetylbacillosamine 2-epimerase (hydrolysing)